jgi:hypothetical protein
MTTLDLVQNKYSSSSPMITFDEFIDDIHRLTPTLVPIIDISIMTIVGTYLSNLSNYHKWKVCHNINDTINSMILDYYEKNKIFDEFHDFDETQTQINIMIQKEKENNTYIDSIRHKIFDTIDRIYKTKIISKKY